MIWLLCCGFFSSGCYVIDFCALDLAGIVLLWLVWGLLIAFCGVCDLWGVLA